MRVSYTTGAGRRVTINTSALITASLAHRALSKAERDHAPTAIVDALRAVWRERVEARGAV